MDEYIVIEEEVYREAVGPVQFTVTTRQSWYEDTPGTDRTDYIVTATAIDPTGFMCNIDEPFRAVWIDAYFGETYGPIQWADWLLEVWDCAEGSRAGRPETLKGFVEEEWFE